MAFFQVVPIEIAGPFKLLNDSTIPSIAHTLAVLENTAKSTTTKTRFRLLSHQKGKKVTDFGRLTNGHPRTVVTDQDVFNGVTHTSSPSSKALIQ